MPKGKLKRLKAKQYQDLSEGDPRYKKLQEIDNTLDIIMLAKEKASESSSFSDEGIPLTSFQPQNNEAMQDAQARLIKLLNDDSYLSLLTPKDNEAISKGAYQDIEGPSHTFDAEQTLIPDATLNFMENTSPSPDSEAEAVEPPENSAEKAAQKKIANKIRKLQECEKVINETFRHSAHEMAEKLYAFATFLPAAEAERARSIALNYKMLSDMPELSLDIPQDWENKSLHEMQAAIEQSLSKLTNYTEQHITPKIPQIIAIASNMNNLACLLEAISKNPASTEKANDAFADAGPNSNAWKATLNMMASSPVQKIMQLGLFFHDLEIPDEKADKLTSKKKMNGQALTDTEQQALRQAQHEQLKALIINMLEPQKHEPKTAELLGLINKINTGDRNYAKLALNAFNEQYPKKSQHSPKISYLLDHLNAYIQSRELQLEFLTQKTKILVALRTVANHYQEKDPEKYKDRITALNTVYYSTTLMMDPSSITAITTQLNKLRQDADAKSNSTLEKALKQLEETIDALRNINITLSKASEGPSLGSVKDLAATREEKRSLFDKHRRSSSSESSDSAPSHELTANEEAILNAVVSESYGKTTFFEETGKHPLDLLNQDAKTALFEGASQQPSTQARETFARFLFEKVLHNTETDLRENTGNPEKDAAILEKLLGKKGVVLYQAALQEEANSIAFRTAVFNHAANAQKGPTWSDQLVVYIGGPSGAGKTHSSKTILDEVGQEYAGNPEGINYYVMVDGGIEREVSHVRQLMVQASLQKGYPGVGDLDSYDTLDTKSKVKNASLKTDNISLVLPQTYVLQGGLDHISGRLAQRSAKSELTKNKKRPKSATKGRRVIYGQVTAEKDMVANQSVGRSLDEGYGADFREKMNGGDEAAKNLVINSIDLPSDEKPKIPECKAPGTNFDKGVRGSDQAKAAYLKASKEELGGEPLVVEITNDRIYLRFDFKTQQSNQTTDKTPFMSTRRAAQHIQKLLDLMPPHARPQTEEAFRAFINPINAKFGLKTTKQKGRKIIDRTNASEKAYATFLTNLVNQYKGVAAKDITKQTRLLRIQNLQSMLDRNQRYCEALPAQFQNFLQSKRFQINSKPSAELAAPLPRLNEGALKHPLEATVFSSLEEPPINLTASDTHTPEEQPTDIQKEGPRPPSTTETFSPRNRSSTEYTGMPTKPAEPVKPSEPVKPLFQDESEPDYLTSQNLFGEEPKLPVDSTPIDPNSLKTTTNLDDLMQAGQPDNPLEETVFEAPVEPLDEAPVQPTAETPSQPIAPNVTDEQGNTPLMQATAKGDIKAIHTLLAENPASLNAVNADGQTALMLAVRDQNGHAVEVLLQANPDITIADNKDRTVVSMVMNQGYQQPTVKNLILEREYTLGKNLPALMQLKLEEMQLHGSATATLATNMIKKLKQIDIDSYESNATANKLLKKFIEKSNTEDTKELHTALQKIAEAVPKIYTPPKAPKKSKPGKELLGLAKEFYKQTNNALAKLKKDEKVPENKKQAIQAMALKLHNNFEKNALDEAAMSHYAQIRGNGQMSAFLSVFILEFNEKVNPTDGRPIKQSSVLNADFYKQAITKLGILELAQEHKLKLDPALETKLAEAAKEAEKQAPARPLPPEEPIGAPPTLTMPSNEAWEAMNAATTDKLKIKPLSSELKQPKHNDVEIDTLSPSTSQENLDLETSKVSSTESSGSDSEATPEKSATKIDESIKPSPSNKEPDIIILEQSYREDTYARAGEPLQSAPPTDAAPTHYDLIVAGGGPAGLACAIEAVKREQSVLIAEKRQFEYIRGQRIFLDENSRNYLLALLPINATHTPADQNFFKEITQNTTMRVRDIERFLAKRLDELAAEKGVSLERKEKSMVSQVSLQDGTLTLGNAKDTENPGTAYQFKNLVCADGFLHETANKIRDDKNESVFSYKDIASPKKPYHGSFYVTIETLNKKKINVGELQFAETKTEMNGEGYLAGLSFTRSKPKEGEAPDLTKINCTFGGEIPKELYDQITAYNELSDDKRNNQTLANLLKANVSEHMKTVIESHLARIGVSEQDIKVTIKAGNPQKSNAAKKQRLKIQAFTTNLKEAEKAVHSEGGHTAFLVGDAYRTPNYQLGHGLNHAFQHAAQFGKVLDGGSIKDYDSHAASISQKVRIGTKATAKTGRVGQALLVRAGNKRPEDIRKAFSELAHPQIAAVIARLAIATQEASGNEKRIAEKLIGRLKAIPTNAANPTQEALNILNNEDAELRKFAKPNPLIFAFNDIKVELSTAPLSPKEEQLLEELLSEIPEKTPSEPTHHLNIFADFDGTLTGVGGQNTWEAYQDYYKEKNGIDPFDASIRQKNYATFLKDQANQAFCIQKEAQTFIKESLKNPLVNLVIVSRSHREFIEAALELADIDPKRVTILDRSTLENTSSKETAVRNYNKNHSTRGRLLFIDDSKDDGKAMASAFEVQPESESILHAQPGKFDFEHIARVADNLLKKIHVDANHELIKHAGNGTPKEIDQDLANGANINTSINSGPTPLMIAALHSRPDLVKHLLEKGADPRITATINNQERNAEGAIDLVLSSLNQDQDSLEKIKNLATCRNLIIEAMNKPTGQPIVNAPDNAATNQEPLEAPPGLTVPTQEAFDSLKKDTEKLKRESAPVDLNKSKDTESTLSTSSETTSSELSTEAKLESSNEEEIPKNKPSFLSRLRQQAKETAMGFVAKLATLAAQLKTKNRLSAEREPLLSRSSAREEKINELSEFSEQSEFSQENAEDSEIEILDNALNKLAPENPSTETVPPGPTAPSIPAGTKRQSTRTDSRRLASPDHPPAEASNDVEKDPMTDVNVLLRNHIAERDLHSITADLKNGADINTTYTSGYTGLMLACQNGDYPMVKHLLDHGANPLMTGTNDYEDKTALTIIKEGITNLLTKEPFHAKDEDKFNDLKTMRGLLITAINKTQNNPDQKKSIFRESRTPLENIITAIEKNDVAAVKEILKEDSDICAAYYKGSPVFVHACQASNADIVSAFLEQNIDGLGALKNAEGNTALTDAIKHNRQPIAELLIKNNMGLNTPDTNQDTPLHLAAAQNNAALIEALIEKPIVAKDKNITNSINETPLLQAAKLNHTEAFNALLKARANPLSTDAKGDTALMHAVRNHNKEMIDTLLEKHNAGPTQQNNKGETPLSVAKKIQKESPDDAGVFDQLLESASKPNLFNRFRAGFLKKADKSQDASELSPLLKNEVDLDAESSASSPSSATTDSPPASELRRPSSAAIGVPVSGAPTSSPAPSSSAPPSASGTSAPTATAAPASGSGTGALAASPAANAPAPRSSGPAPASASTPPPSPSAPPPPPGSAPAASTVLPAPAARAPVVPAAPAASKATGKIFSVLDMKKIIRDLDVNNTRLIHMVAFAEQAALSETDSRDKAQLEKIENTAAILASRLDELYDDAKATKDNKKTNQQIITYANALQAKIDTVRKHFPKIEKALDEAKTRAETLRDKTERVAHYGDTASPFTQADYGNEHYKKAKEEMDKFFGGATMHTKAGSLGTAITTTDASANDKTVFEAHTGNTLDVVSASLRTVRGSTHGKPAVLHEIHFRNNDAQKMQGRQRVGLHSIPNDAIMQWALKRVLDFKADAQVEHGEMNVNCAGFTNDCIEAIRIVSKLHNMTCYTQNSGLQLTQKEIDARAKLADKKYGGQGIIGTANDAVERPRGPR
jgi:ankyrin repeat protein/2-polyprenyl-6-methoxyphenol hydroxylase-like FAD-dependent oxidoreductase